MDWEKDLLLIQSFCSPVNNMVLREFELRSGLKVSMEKTSFYASGLTEHETQLIQASTGMRMGSLPFRYLGVPLNSKKLNLVSCEPLLQQIKAKFSSWSVKSLSFAGRLLLIKTVIAGITTFWCSSFILPKACIRKINSLCSVFLWRGDAEGSNVARVSWETVVLTKEPGGLGIKDLLTWNKACTIRLIWLLFFRAGSVWVAWFKEEILKGSLSNYWTTKPTASFSWLVNKLLKLKDTVYLLIKLRLGNGLTARFWFDNWSPFGCLYTFLNGSNSRLGIPLRATVGSLVTNGRWSLPPARSEEQLQLQTYLTTVQLTEEDDHYDWEINGSPALRYQTGNIYTYLRSQLAKIRWEGVVWTKRGIPRHNFLLWLVVLNRIPTRDRLIRWGLQVSPTCLLCNAADESRTHLFQDCSFSYEVWSIQAERLRLQPLRSWEDTLTQMINLPKGKPLTRLSLLAWQAMIYWLWNERNARLHSNTFRSVETLDNIIYRQLKNRIQSFRNTNPLVSSEMMQLWI